MDLIRLYQGYQLNRNHFFAPSETKRSQNLRPLKPKRPKDSGLLKRLVTSKPLRRRAESPEKSNLITPSTLSFHLNRLSSTPIPRKSTNSAGIQTIKASPTLRQVHLKINLFKDSFDMQDSSNENILFSRVSFESLSSSSHK
jgi:hypothetical protein